LINLSHVVKTYDNKNFVVNDISVEVMPGELVVFLGSSGSGKTTTLKMINRLVEPTSGRITIYGKDIHSVDPTQLRRSIGYVFQGIGLFPHMTIEENVTMMLRLKGVSEEKRIMQARNILESVNLEPEIYASRYPDELSGGQQQRVAVARALITDPHLLLMDEPFGALDAINRHNLQSELLALKKRLKKTIVFVTHDIFEAMRLGDRIVVMNKGQIEQIGTKREMIQSPATPFVKELFAGAIRHLQEYLDLLDG
jgi:osmoprotectant transport system ATP-binding protein